MTAPAKFVKPARQLFSGIFAGQTWQTGEASQKRAESRVQEERDDFHDDQNEELKKQGLLLAAGKHSVFPFATKTDAVFARVSMRAFR